MKKNSFLLSTSSSSNIYLIIALSIYLMFILTWYYKPPWLIDHLIYVHIANALDSTDLNFWNFHRPELPVGHHNERWGILVPIILFNKLFFFLDPGIASQVLIVSVHAGIMVSIYFILSIYNNRIANYFLILWLFASHHTKNRATEILAEPFSILYVCISILCFMYFEKNRKQAFLFLAIFFQTLLPLVKIHLGIFSLILLIIYFDLIKKNYRFFFYYIILTILILNLILFLNYGTNNYLTLIKNSLGVYLVYFKTGLPVGPGPEGGWITVWFNKLISETTLMPIFLISSIYVFCKKFERENIFGLLTIVFLILIFILSANLSFPANQSYARPIHFFSIACLAILFDDLTKSLKYKSFILPSFFIASVLPLILIFFLGKYQKNDQFTSLYIITIISTFIFLPYLIFRKNDLLKYLLLLFLCSSNFFWNNWNSISDHYSWRNGYSEHYKFLTGSSELLKKFDDEKILVHFSTWPINKNLLRRERMYAEPGIRSLIRNKVDITSSIFNDKYEEKNFDLILSDKKNLNLVMLSEIVINSRLSGKLYLYKAK